MLRIFQHSHITRFLFKESLLQKTVAHYIVRPRPRLDSPGNVTTPGYIAPHLWREQRTQDEFVRKYLFGSEPRTTSESTNDFLQSLATPILLGQPTRSSDFLYEPCQSFTEDPLLDHRLLQNLQTCGLTKPSPVQQHAIGILRINQKINDAKEEIIGKYDLMAAAQTGSGKTVAFLVPLLNRLMEFYPDSAMQSLKSSHFQCQYPSALIVTPTRELTQQVYKELSKLVYRTHVRGLALFGGEQINRQSFQLSKGCHVVVATPGRLVDFLEQGVISLKHCHSLVLDEADRMLDMGFEPQLKNIIQNPKFQMPPTELRQTALFSATFPHDVAYLARDMLRGPSCLSLGIAYHAEGEQPDRNSAILVPEWGKTVSRDAQSSNLLSHIPKEIELRVQAVHQPSQEGRLRHAGPQWHEAVCGILDELLAAEQESRILVFCNTKREVDRLDESMYRLGYKSLAIHGSHPQNKRSHAVENFRLGKVQILVATSVAARGLDFPRVQAVINAGLPVTMDDFVHRCGRTGRLGQKGLAVTLFDPRTDTGHDVAKGICQLVKARGHEVPLELQKFAEEQHFAQHRRFSPANSSNSYQNRNKRNYDYQQRDRQYRGRNSF